MTSWTLYRGVWPQVVSKLAKYAVRYVNGELRVSVLYEIGEGLRYLAVEDAQEDVVERVNAVKTSFGDAQGGAFYVNEYRHIVVPVNGSAESGLGSHYYYAGRLESDFVFEFEGRPLTTKPIGSDGSPLLPGERWVGPRPGVPYVLAAGGADIYYETPALTDTNPPKVRPRVIRQAFLSKVLGDPAAVASAVKRIRDVRGYDGGRFYVNEFAAMFTPVDPGDGNGLDYIYCGQIDPSEWFPEPSV